MSTNTGCILNQSVKKSDRKRPNLRRCSQQICRLPNSYPVGRRKKSLSYSTRQFHYSEDTSLSTGPSLVPSNYLPPTTTTSLLLPKRTLEPLCTVPSPRSDSPAAPSPRTLSMPPLRARLSEPQLNRLDRPKLKNWHNDATEMVAQTSPVTVGEEWVKQRSQNRQNRSQSQGWRDR